MHEPQTTGVRRAKRRRALLSGLSLAALAAVGTGIGLAPSSAAWTDNVYLRASAAAGTANLQGAIGPANGAVPASPTWAESSDPGAIELTWTVSGITPSDTITLPFSIRNTGSVPVAATYQVTAAGDLFAPTGQAPIGTLPSGSGGVAADRTAGAPASAVLTTMPAATVPGGSAAVSGTVTITSPNWTGFQRQGATGTVTIRVLGTVD